MGFTLSLSDPGTYVKIIGQDIIIHIVYVDNTLFTGSKELLVNARVKTFMKRWESRYLGKAKEYLGYSLHLRSFKGNFDPGPNSLCGESYSMLWSGEL
jgi:hypothetical protein